jgi:FAD/FMN-containing dehydrogenase/Fe-S oxidoreductase
LNSKFAWIKIIDLKTLEISGEIYSQLSSRILYSTDASAYREMPYAVTYPKNADDIKKIIQYSQENKIGIIPRTAGTSLAGQVVGNGIIVDVSKHFTKILEVNKEEKWVRVQPGVVLDELNIYLKQFGLFFGPETSTSNRCMIGGMAGNNACGAHSIIYGSTRDHLLEVKGFLSDGSEVAFKPLTKIEFEEKCGLNSLEGNIYRHIRQLLTNPENRKLIDEEYPDPDLKRRNTGYAIDLLLKNEVFGDNHEKFNFCKLIAGSEGTLFFITEIKLNLVPVPPKEKGLICVHCHTLEEALEGNLVALTLKPDAIELIDDVILQCTKGNIEQRKNRFFIEGDPGAILVVEFARETKEEILQLHVKLERALRDAGYGYHFPLITGSDINKVWALRKAALGLLSNVPGDAKPVSLVEDTAVHPRQLPAYIADFKAMLKKYNLTSVFHAHIATGELHLRPVIDIKTREGIKLFRTVATETAHLVKKYKGSLSGEHGDGRLRGEFIPIIIGEHNYNLCKELKHVWDPNNIFNPGKIVNTPPMDTSLRIESGRSTPEVKTYFDFSESQGFVRHIERCNGSGDCRKSEIIGGPMCPSYMATKDESATTRARANILREMMYNPKKNDPFDSKDIKEILDLCLSCKACKAECPSNVDMTKLKAEFTQHYYDIHGVPIRSWFIANMPAFYKLGSLIPKVYNYTVSQKYISYFIKKAIGFAPQRSIPTLDITTVKHWYKKNQKRLNNSMKSTKKTVVLFIDEFTNYIDCSSGIKAIELLTKLDYKVEIAPCFDSGRTSLSKGLVKKARKLAIKNVNALCGQISEENPLLGLEPSSILTFRDEYPELVSKNLLEQSKNIASNTFLIEEFIATEFAIGNIERAKFSIKQQKIALHGHCYQKALSTTKPILDILRIPENYEVSELATGCCGMAGAFGYEKEHYEVSMKVGNLKLFPSINATSDDTIIAASGTSCRQQIKDGTGRKAYHPVEILAEAFIE